MPIKAKKLDNLRFFGLHSNMYLAEVLELVDKLDSGSSGRMPVRVRVPFSASKATLLISFLAVFTKLVFGTVSNRPH